MKQLPAILLSIGTFLPVTAAGTPLEETSTAGFHEKAYTVTESPSDTILAGQTSAFEAGRAGLQDKADSLFTGQAPKYEVRAAWITTAYGLDWPRTRATTPQSMRKQQDELVDILDKLKAANFNTVLFQARTRGDVFYDSAIEPYNALLTGKTGASPGYDPLAFAIEECHKRGMECHAWIVSVPLGNSKHVSSLGKASVTKKRPAICITYKRQYFLNPGHPAAKEYLMELVSEMVRNYDLDGVHFDYLRYPEHARFPDNAQFKKYGNGRTLEEWRRDNLTDIVRYIYNGVKALKPWVKVSTCPVGKYADTTRYPSRGWNALHAVNQDVQAWLREGIQDQIYPMLYFRGNNFYPFVLDWQEHCNGRQVVPGLGVYFLDPSEGNWKIDEVQRQMNFLRQENVPGAAFYRVQYLMQNTQGLYDLLGTFYYNTPALQPPMTWLDDEPPAAPTGLQAEALADGYWRISWQPGTDNDTRNAPTYVVYASDTDPVDTADPANIVAQRVTGTEFIYAPLFPWDRRCYITVTATDRYGNESASVSNILLSPVANLAK